MTTLTFCPPDKPLISLYWAISGSRPTSSNSFRMALAERSRLPAPSRDDSMSSNWVKSFWNPYLIRSSRGNQALCCGVEVMAKL